MRYAKRWTLIVITTLAIMAIIGTSILAFLVDRAQCKAAVTAIENSRTMWEYLAEQNPGPEADAFLVELDRRIPEGHCRGGALILHEGVTSTTTAP